ncbi:bile acid:sodium symporter family protein [Thauera sinica]|uniref:Bile acid:sodium symporter family protein n=1 Tax=Thauera sinica TaxID=2665146 RepID=A0ABW1AKR9_9RHOO|nr:bile acid:sodium symporter family protein [Thauera sp. K11]ATE59832.1 hypothetical protein CCZ27_07595 [Thauera sp. K11]
MTPSWLGSFKVDPYLVALVATVAFASIFPAQGAGVEVLDFAVQIAIAGLFFVYGARLSTGQVLSALLRWKPQLAVFATTYLVFPLVGLLLVRLFGGNVDEGIAIGILFLSILPSTVQSSIAFTSIARGNVAAALCAASVSNLAGVVLTPALMALLITSTAGHAMPGSAVKDIALQILAPFIAGQFARPLLAGWLGRHKFATMLFDRGSILLVVYSAFSAGMLAGVWKDVSAQSLVWIALLDVLLLALIMAFTWLASRSLRFERGDEIAVVFCGSKKSLASGIPMANVLFPAHTVSLVVIPLMLFHQLQLFVCAVLARRYAANDPAHDEATASE